jgi:hypothetical protein
VGESPWVYGQKVNIGERGMRMGRPKTVARGREWSGRGMSNTTKEVRQGESLED